MGYAADYDDYVDSLTDAEQEAEYNARQARQDALDVENSKACAANGAEVKANEAVAAAGDLDADETADLYAKTYAETYAHDLATDDASWAAEMAEDEDDADNEKTQETARRETYDRAYATYYSEVHDHERARVYDEEGGNDEDDEDAE